MPAVQSENAELILLHLRRYRVTTAETLQRLFYPDAKNDDALKSQLRRLRTRRLIASSRDAAARPPATWPVYYYLTEEGSKRVQLPRTSDGSFRTIPDLFQHFAVMLFCCREEAPRPRFTEEEFDRAFPRMRLENRDLKVSFSSLDLFLDSSGDQPRLGRVLVGSADAPKILKSCREAYDKACQTLGEFVRDDLFSLAVVVPTGGLATRVLTALGNHPLRPGPALPVHVEAYPALLPFLEKHPSAKTR